jgi:beta-phosphoglucomutase-like phosphatase (HAD superfamily)
VKLECDPNSFDAVLFDMDGTLTDNARFHASAWLEFLKTKFGYDLGCVDI